MAKLERIEVGPETKGPQRWQYTHKETWRSDDIITHDDLKALKDKHYNQFPVVRVNFEIQGDMKTVVVTVVEDNCQ